MKVIMDVIASPPSRNSLVKSEEDTMGKYIYCVRLFFIAKTCIC